MQKQQRTLAEIGLTAPSQTRPRPPPPPHTGSQAPPRPGAGPVGSAVLTAFRRRLCNSLSEGQQISDERCSIALHMVVRCRRLSHASPQAALFLGRLATAIALSAANDDGLQVAYALDTVSSSSRLTSIARLASWEHQPSPGLRVRSTGCLTCRHLGQRRPNLDSRSRVPILCGPNDGIRAHDSRRDIIRFARACTCVARCRPQCGSCMALLILPWLRTMDRYMHTRTRCGAERLWFVVVFVEWGQAEPIKLDRAQHPLLIPNRANHPITTALFQPWDSPC